MSPMSSASLKASQRHNRVYVQAVDQFFFSKQPDKQQQCFDSSITGIAAISDNSVTLFSKEEIPHSFFFAVDHLESLYQQQTIFFFLSSFSFSDKMPKTLLFLHNTKLAQCIYVYASSTHQNLFHGSITTFSSPLIARKI